MDIAIERVRPKIEEIVSAEKSEHQIQLIVGDVERIFVRAGFPRMAGERENLCGLSAQLVQVSAERHGLSSNIFGTEAIHRNLGGDASAAFGHAFNIVKSGENYFLIDETFGQYITSDDQISQGGDSGEKIGTLDEHSIGYALARNGYVLLDDEALRDYLKATTEAKDINYIEQATFEKVFTNRRNFGVLYSDENYLDGFISGREVIDLSRDSDDGEGEF